MDKLTFYFDRNLGRRMPQALIHLQAPFDVRWHNGENFPDNMPDDAWMEIVGAKGWIVLSQDFKFHKTEFENEAVKQHSIKCFYLPDATARTWKTLCALVRAHERMIAKSLSIPAPFIFRLHKNGRLTQIAL